jgi:hypothetical protein
MGSPTVHGRNTPVTINGGNDSNHGNDITDSNDSNARNTPLVSVSNKRTQNDHVLNFTFDKFGSEIVDRVKSATQ